MRSLRFSSLLFLAGRVELFIASKSILPTILIWFSTSTLRNVNTSLEGVVGTSTGSGFTTSGCFTSTGLGVITTFSFTGSGTTTTGAGFGSTGAGLAATTSSTLGSSAFALGLPILSKSILATGLKCGRSISILTSSTFSTTGASSTTFSFSWRK